MAEYRWLEGLLAHDLRKESRSILAKEVEDTAQPLT